MMIFMLVYSHYYIFIIFIELKNSDLYIFKILLNNIYIYIEMCLFILYSDIIYIYI